MSRKRYPTDLTDLQWTNIAHLVPAPKPGGRPAKYDRRDLLDAVFYLLATGCSWRMLPHDFPPWDPVYGYFRRWQKDGTWAAIHDALRDDCRFLEGRGERPTAAAVDSQSVKMAPLPGPRGFDGGKKGRRPQAARAGGRRRLAAGGAGHRGRRERPRRGPAPTPGR
jgi:putative transposase